MRKLFLFLAIAYSQFFFLDAATADNTDSSVRNDFIDNFEQKYQGEYTLNPSPSCQPVRKATKVKVDLVKNSPRTKIRVIYIDDAGKVVGSKLYPIDDSRFAVVNSTSREPNSLLWETNVTDRSVEVPRTGTEYERMTFNEHALSFDILKTRDPVGMFRFFKPTETVGETRCNFTRTEFMKAPPEKYTAPKRERPRVQGPTIR